MKPLAVRVVIGLLATTFIGTGLWKLVTPIAKLASMMPWMGEVSPAFLYLTAVFDLLGGAGLLVRRVRLPAALGCAALQASAVVFHLSRGEAKSTPFNLLLIVLSLIVAAAARPRAKP